MAELANCNNCNEVFVKTVRDICQKCFEEEEKDYETVYRFLMKRKNRQATIMEIVEETGVDEDLIIKFIREKRLRTTQFPNLSYPCDRCGDPINDGRICDSCSNEMIDALKHHEKVEKQVNQRKEQETEKVNVYYTLKTDKK